MVGSCVLWYWERCVGLGRGRVVGGVFLWFEVEVGHSIGLDLIWRGLGWLVLVCSGVGVMLL